MKNVKKTVRKGFTLVELVVVMAIFAILLVGVMSLTGPVSRMLKSASLAEKTYSYANNIQVYLQGKLEYADSLYVFTSDKIDKDGVAGVSSTDLAMAAEAFRADHYDNIVTNYGGSEHPTEGKIYIMRLANTNEGGVKPGQITLRTYPFVSNASITPLTNPPEVDQLNSSFFDAQDNQVYSYNYALGSTVLVDVPDPISNTFDSFRALKNDVEDTNNGIEMKDMSISIVINKDSTSNGYVDVTGAQSYRAFRNPVVLQLANLPLTNINYRSVVNHTNASYGVKRMVPDAAAPGNLRTQTNTEAGEGWKKDVYPLVDFSKDIYFVFAYADELT